MYWFSLEDPNDPGVYVNKIGLSYNDAGGGYLESSVNISYDNNQSITGVTADYWDNLNQGNVDAHKYSLITVVVDYANWSTDNYVTWYWNLSSYVWNDRGLKWKVKQPPVNVLWLVFAKGTA